MQELFNLEEKADGTIAVSGRELHKGLEIETQYSIWIKRMIGYGFEENVDYVEVSQKRLTSHGREHSQIDHIMALDMAKEISMIQRSEIGKQIRKYFIEVEKSYKQQPQISDSYMIDDPVERAKRWIEEEQQREKLTVENEMLKPKASYYDLVLRSKSLLSVTEIAKDYGMGAKKFNNLLHELGVQYRLGKVWHLYAKHQDKGYTHSATFVIDEENSKITTKWTQAGRLFLYETLKENGIFPTMEKEV